MQKASPPGAASRQQQAIMKIMPLMFGFIGFTFPAGLVLYWTVSNLFQIGQQTMLLRAGHIGPDALERRMAEQRAKKADEAGSTPEEGLHGSDAGASRGRSASSAQGRGPAEASPRGGQREGHLQGRHASESQRKAPRFRRSGRGSDAPRRSQRWRRETRSGHLARRASSALDELEVRAGAQDRR